MGTILLARHGETDWSAVGRHTSVTDPDLNDVGVQQAKALGTFLTRRDFAAVLCSPRIRAFRTAELAGLTITHVVADLVERNYGKYEGLTSAQIRESIPEWTAWGDSCPGGEPTWRLGARVDRVLSLAGEFLQLGDVALVGHAHALQAAAARWTALPASAGELLRLDPGNVSELGYERRQPVIVRWNVALT